MSVVLSRLLCDPVATPEVVVEDLGGPHILRALRLVEPPAQDPDFVRSIGEHHTETDEEWALRVLGRL
jgi:hypothetical protein